jgi:hypothetical protein
MSSLPVPVSPVMSTVESVGATLATRAITACRAGEAPTISLEHEGGVDFFAQRDVLVVELVL